MSRRSCGWQILVYNFLGSLALITSLRIFIKFHPANQFYNTRNPAELWLNVGDFKNSLAYLRIFDYCLTGAKIDFPALFRKCTKFYFILTSDRVAPFLSN